MIRPRTRCIKKGILYAMLYDDYDIQGQEDDGTRQEPILTPAEQYFWYWEEKTFKYYQRLMQPSWITHRARDI